MGALKFVNKTYTCTHYEWGRNCATLGYTPDQTKRVIEDFPEMLDESAYHFWKGYDEGPRPNNEIYTLSL